MRAAKCVSGVEKERQPPLRCQFGQCRDIAAAAPEMDPQNAGRPRSNELIDFVGVDRVRDPVDVAKDGSDLLPRECVRGGNECKSGDDDLARQSECPNRKFQRHRSIRDGNAVPNAKLAGDSTLKFCNKRSAVGQPMPVESAGDAIEDCLLVRQIRPADMQRLSKRGLVAEDREARPLRRH